TDRSKLEALAVDQAFSIPHDQLHGAAPDVDDQGRSVREGDTVLDAQKDQPSFLCSADHPHPQPRLLQDQGDEITAVLGFAHGTGRDGDDTFESLGAGERDQRLEDFQRTAHGLVREPSGCEYAVAQPRHILKTVEYLETGIGENLSQHHMNRVRSDVDDGEFRHKSSLGVENQWTLMKVRAACQQSACKPCVTYT